MNYFNIENSIKLYQNKKIERIYVQIDIHGTILTPRIDKNEISTDFYKDSKEVLRFLSQQEEFYLILSTCSYPDQVIAYLNMFQKEGIIFKDVNENKEVDTNFGGYVVKSYANVILDDKAGFEGQDWTPIKEILIKYYPNFAKLVCQHKPINFVTENFEHTLKCRLCGSEINPPTSFFFPTDKV